jgi:hypothetical protein
MRLLNVRSEVGNATIEFLAFAVLLFAPLASFSATTSVGWVAKQQVTSAATQLARAQVIGSAEYARLAERLAAEYPGIEFEVETSACCVSVSVKLLGVASVARQVS